MLGGPRDFLRLARGKLQRTLGAVLGRLYPNTMRFVSDRAARSAAAASAASTPAAGRRAPLRAPLRAARL